MSALPLTILDSYTPGWLDVFLAIIIPLCVVFWKKIVTPIMIMYRWLKSFLTHNENLDIRLTSVETSVNHINNAIDKIQEAVAPSGGATALEIASQIQSTVRQLEVTIIKSDARVSALADQDSIGRFECDADGKCIKVNNRLSEIFGITKEEMLANGWTKTVPMEYRTTVLHAWMDSVRNDMPYDYVYPVQPKKNGPLQWVKATAIPVRYNDNIIQYMGTVSLTSAPIHADTQRIQIEEH